jgi:hypothetical protein
VDPTVRSFAVAIIASREHFYPSLLIPGDFDLAVRLTARQPLDDRMAIIPTALLLS